MKPHCLVWCSLPAHAEAKKPMFEFVAERDKDGNFVSFELFYLDPSSSESRVAVTSDSPEFKELSNMANRVEELSTKGRWVEGTNPEVIKAEMDAERQKKLEEENARIQEITEAATDRLREQAANPEVQEAAVRAWIQSNLQDAMKEIVRERREAEAQQ